MKKILIIITLSIFFYALYHIINYYNESSNTMKQILNIKNNIINNDSNNNEENNIIENNIDFDYLNSINTDTIGWIQVDGTNIDYPFLQYNDNTYYLKHSFDKSYNNAGWIFMDYRNNSFLDKNTIIYGHGRYDLTMFGSLKNILTDEWFNNSNHMIKIITKTNTSIWQVFSVYRIPTTSDYLQINFDDNDEFINFSKTLINRSYFDFNTSINTNDKILTLSTCYNKYKRIVLHAKLIE